MIAIPMENTMVTMLTASSILGHDGTQIMGRTAKILASHSTKKKAYIYILPTLSELRIGDINSYFSAWYKYRCETGFG